MKYIDADKLKKIVEQAKQRALKGIEVDEDLYCDGRADAFGEVLLEIDFLQHKQPIGGKQVVIITETDGEANIHWDCRSLDDVKALLASAQSSIADKQVEELRGIGSGPDCNTTEGRFRNAHKFQQEQPEVDFEKAYKSYIENRKDDVSGCAVTVNMKDLARHFYELGKARKGE